MIATKNNFGIEIKGILRNDLLQVSHILAMPLRVCKVKGEMGEIVRNGLEAKDGRSAKKLREVLVFVL